jgi:Icc-related predicted phosphoesterase
MIRIAAVSDIHFGHDSAGTLRPDLEDISERADLLLIGGDLTHRGEVTEAEVLTRELAGLGVPTLGVLGNHDYHSDQDKLVRERLEDAGVRVLEGESAVVEAAGQQVGIAGTKGFGGGFAGASGSEFGEPIMKAFIAHTRECAERLRESLEDLRDVDFRVVLLHYSPIEGTLEGERREIYPFLGSYRLADAVDAGGADLVIPGHAHAGRETGTTPAGTPVRNVAQPVIKRAYRVYWLGRPVPDPAPDPGIETGEGTRPWASGPAGPTGHR